MAVSRGLRAGCRSGLALSCARMSGEALTSAQAWGSVPRTTIEDWVRACVRNEPRRTPVQLRQLQFHWGKPPPAADPRTRIFTIRSVSQGLWGPATERARGARWPGSSRPHSNVQRLLMYIVISMPKRKSVACGVSQRIVLILVEVG